MNSWFVIVSLLPFFASRINCMCDQRPFGGKLMCCSGKDSKCFTKVDTKWKHGQSKDVCYCDSHCKFTKDCCPDYEKVKRLCNSRFLEFFFSDLPFPIINYKAFKILRYSRMCFT